MDFFPDDFQTRPVLKMFNHVQPLGLNTAKTRKLCERACSCLFFHSFVCLFVGLLLKVKASKPYGPRHPSAY